jgi:hypothetical protein
MTRPDSPAEWETAERLVSAVEQLSLARSVDAVVAIVRTAARQLVGADGASFILKEGDCCFYVDEDAIAPMFKGRRFPESICIGGWAMRNREPVVIEDVYQDQRIPIEAYRPTFIRSLVMVPVRVAAPIAAIGTYWADPHAPTEREVRLLQTLANSTSVAMENIEVYAALERRVAERTAALELKNKELDRFTHSVAHDLKAPLRSIDGFSGILMEQHGPTLNPDARRLLEVVRRSALHMTRLIDDLLAYARMDARPRQRQTVDIAVLVSEVLGERGDELRSRHTEVTRSFELREVSGDPDGLRMALRNLIDNALKFTPADRTPQIEISCRAIDGQAVVSVRDHGIGFDMKFHDRIFEIFERLHGQAEFPGTGVGLAIVRKAMERMGGSARAESTRGEGATFFLELPG